MPPLQIPVLPDSGRIPDQEAQSLLGRAKRAVETAIEEGEAAGMDFLKAGRA